jgi:hypothetical protein
MINNPEAAVLSFDFLDGGQGAVLQVIHTGRSSDDISITGTVKGVGNPTRRNISQNPSNASF